MAEAARGQARGTVQPFSDGDCRNLASVTVVLPCLNEEEGVGPTVREALMGLGRAGFRGDVLVVDNGSSDRSVARASEAGARVIHEARRGYGAAHLAGIRAADSDIIVMADADCTYDLANVGDLIMPLFFGSDMVVASRLDGAVQQGAMPFLHRYLGTPLITRLLCLLTGVPLSDSQSGYRAFWRATLLSLDLRASGMEYASEMLLRAGRAGLRVTETPTDYRPRVGKSKLNTFGDGWRHIQMLLLLSPHLALIFPGMAMALIGLIVCLLGVVFPAGLPVAGMTWPPIYFGPMSLILGAQAMLLGAIAAHRSPLTPAGIRSRLSFLEAPNAVNRLLTRFLGVAMVGVALDVALFLLWSFGRSSDRLIGVAGLAQSLIVIGGCAIVTIFAVDYSRESLGW